MSTDYIPQWQTYKFTNLVLFSNQRKEPESNFGIEIQFHHSQQFVAVDFENVTMKYGNLTFLHKNKYCKGEFKTKIKSITLHSLETIKNVMPWF